MLWQVTVVFTKATAVYTDMSRSQTNLIGVLLVDVLYAGVTKPDFDAKWSEGSLRAISNVTQVPASNITVATQPLGAAAPPPGAAGTGSAAAQPSQLIGRKLLQAVADTGVSWRPDGAWGIMSLNKITGLEPGSKACPCPQICQLGCCDGHLMAGWLVPHVHGSQDTLYCSACSAASIAQRVEHTAV